MEPFSIEFQYGGIPYQGLVRPGEENGQIYYAVQMESDNQESYLQLIAKPCHTDKMDWCLREMQSDAPGAGMDKDLIQEIGEAIEKYEAHNG
jgi:hypothetical protein